MFLAAKRKKTTATYETMLNEMITCVCVATKKLLLLVLLLSRLTSTDGAP
jgi:hypothetical protein